MNTGKPSNGPLNQEPPVFHLLVEDRGERQGDQAVKAAEALYLDLHKYLPDSLETGLDAKAKGDPVTLLVLGVALAKSDAVAELVRCVRDWIRSRPERRSVTVRDSAGKELISVSAENVEDATVIEAIKTAAGLGRT